MHSEAFKTQATTDHTGYMWVIIDDQDRHHGASLLLETSSELVQHGGSLPPCHTLFILVTALPATLSRVRPAQMLPPILTLLLLCAATIHCFASELPLQKALRIEYGSKQK
jgi:hypothetical protein